MFPRMNMLNLNLSRRNDVVMMLYPPMNKLTANVPNRYLLVNVVARRARQIAQDAEDAGEKMDVKPVTLAINEVAEGKISVAAAEVEIKDVE